MKLKITEKYSVLTSNKQIVNNKNITSLVVKKKTRTKVYHT
jgi:hypothetical protein